MMPEEKIRRSVCAGTWYTENPDRLVAEIDGYLGKAEKKSQHPKIIIVPHAGYQYSGEIAALGFAQLDKNVKRIIILGTSHHYPLRGASIDIVDMYRTPLGDVHVCKETKTLLRQQEQYGILNVPEAHAQEHSIEIELPFLQRTITNACIIPIIVGKVDSEKFSLLLERLVDEDAVIVVSVDLSHFHSYTEAILLDRMSIDAMITKNAQKIQYCEIDSPYAVAAVLKLAKRLGYNSELLQYKNSGDVTGDKDSVVGYAAIAFYETYTKQEIDYMLTLARNAVETHIRDGKKIEAEQIPEKLNEQLACFVTLTINGQLRGCIGSLQASEPLYKNIIDNAINAAVHDPRFKPISRKEFDRLCYEISILTTPKKITYKTDKELFEKIKYKGVVLSKGLHQATYLPQVWEHFSEPQEFLESLCHKAGLPKDAWKEQIHIEVYDAIVVGGQ